MSHDPAREPVGGQDDDVSLSDAASGVLRASYSLMTHRIDLGLLEIREMSMQAVRGSIAVRIGTGIFLLGWTALSGFVFLIFEPLLTARGALATLAIVNLGLGGAALWLTLRRFDASVSGTNRRDTGFN